MHNSAVWWSFYHLIQLLCSDNIFIQSCIHVVVAMKYNLQWFSTNHVIFQIIFIHVYQMVSVMFSFSFQPWKVSAHHQMLPAMFLFHLMVSIIFNFSFQPQTASTLCRMAANWLRSAPTVVNTTVFSPLIKTFRRLGGTLRPKNLTKPEVSSVLYTCSVVLFLSDPGVPGGDFMVLYRFIHWHRRCRLGCCSRPQPTLNFQGQIWNLLYLGLKWSDCHETKSKHIDWTQGLKCDHRVWPWPWPWPWIFKVKHAICYISTKSGLKVRCKDLPDSDQGDFRCRHAVDSSCYTGSFLQNTHSSHPIAHQ